MRHTPGPWYYQEDSDAYTHIVRGPLNRFLCSTPQGSMGVDEANARLMAAAPELLFALKTALSFASIKFGNLDPDYNTFSDAACRIISKAEGKL